MQKSKVSSLIKSACVVGLVVILSGCMWFLRIPTSPKPSPLITEHQFSQELVVTYQTGEVRRVVRTMDCSFDDARWQGGDWRIYFDTISDWQLVDEPYLLSDQSSLYGQYNGWVVLHSEGDEIGDESLEFVFGRCHNYMGIGNRVDYYSIEDRIMYRILTKDSNGPTYRSRLHSDDFYEQWGIKEIEFFSDNPIQNETIVPD